MPQLIKAYRTAQAEIEKMLHYRFWDKERERSNRAVGLASSAQGTARRCPMHHDMIAWSGPPHDAVQAYICLRCNAAACEPEIKDRGYDFNTCPDWIMTAIMDEDLKRQAGGNPVSFGGFNG